MTPNNNYKKGVKLRNIGLSTQETKKHLIGWGRNINRYLGNLLLEVIDVIVPRSPYEFQYCTLLCSPEKPGTVSSPSG